MNLSGRALLLAAAVLAGPGLSPAVAAADAGPEADAGIAPASETGGASITVVLTDRSGRPVPGAEVFVEALAPGGERRRMEMETDTRGEARVLGVPAELEQVVAGFRGGEGLFATSGPIELAAGRDARVELVVPEATESRADLSIAMLHVVLERKGGRVEVTEAISLQSAPGTSYRGAPIRLPLPRGAAAPFVPAREGEAPAAAVDEAGFAVRGPIPAEGLDLELRFELPIGGERIAFEQRLGLPVKTVRAVSTWTADGAALGVGGVQPAEIAQLTSGLAALVAMGPGPRDGRLSVTMTGLRAGPEVPWRIGALIAAILLVLLGALWRLRRKPTAREAGR